MPYIVAANTRKLVRNLKVRLIMNLTLDLLVRSNVCLTALHSFDSHWGSVVLRGTVYQFLGVSWANDDQFQFGRVLSNPPQDGSWDSEARIRLSEVGTNRIVLITNAELMSGFVTAVIDDCWLDRTILYRRENSGRSVIQLQPELACSIPPVSGFTEVTRCTRIVRRVA